MYIDRSTWSIKSLQQAVALLEKTANYYEQKQDGNSAMEINWLQDQITVITRAESYLTAIINQLSFPQTKYQKLRLDLLQAVNEYLKTNPKPVSQREQSIQRLREWITLLDKNRESYNEKFNDLANAVINELNAVERDHNKSYFSAFFTTSRLAQAYMTVLRNCCIDPHQQVYAYSYVRDQAVATLRVSGCNNE